MKINISKIKPHTYVSVIMVAIAIVNYVLTYLGKPLIVVGEDQITYIVNIVLNIAFASLQDTHYFSLTSSQ